MGFKSDDRCLAKVDEDEPIFVLRAQDLLAPGAIRFWFAQATSTLTDEHRQEVRDRMRQFEAWQANHPDRVKKPD